MPQVARVILTLPGKWRSLAARSVRDAEVAGSNPAFPTLEGSRVGPVSLRQKTYWPDNPVVVNEWNGLPRWGTAVTRTRSAPTRTIEKWWRSRQTDENQRSWHE
jgi:hypothetical protein